MPPTKRRKLSDDEEEEAHDSADESGLDGGSEAESSEQSPSDGDEDNSSIDTEDELEGLKRKKSLLSTDVPSAAPLSLKPSIARKHNDQKLELKAKKVLQIEKKEKEDKRRIKDPIGGWGGESERALRKVAQRGVVKLFNAIQQSQATVAAAAEEAKGERGSGKPRLSAPIVEAKGKKKGKKKDNIIGRGKETAVDKDEFFSMIKSGGIVSKA
ncbi:hypothetical protein H1R20_g9912, partial [Candolleomyces eurysporus]